MSDQGFVDFVIEQIKDAGFINYKKMFGEYLIYANDKPAILICDNTAFVKMIAELNMLLADAPRGFPYKGAKEHYILDIDNSDLVSEAVRIIERNSSAPKPKKRKK